VASFKIEGRLKTPEYVANITRHYRQAIDTAVAGRPVSFTPREVEEMELSFSRGFSPGWLHGCDHKMLVPATTSAKRGVRLGTVAEVRRDRVAVDLVASVKRGDGIAIDCGETSDHAAGGRVYEVFVAGRSLTEPVAEGRVELAFAHGAIDMTRLKPGQAVWKTDDQELTARLRKTFAGDSLRRRQPVDLHVTATVGEPLRVTARTALGASCEVASVEPARAATKHALSVETLRDQLGRLGGTPFDLRGLTAEITGSPMLPFSLLGAVRHDLIAALERAVARSSAPDRRGRERGVIGNDTRGLNVPQPTTTVPTLHILVRSLDQLRRVLELGERRIQVEFADIRHYRDAVDRCRAVGATILLATPRIQKPDELGIFRLMAKQEPDGVLVRNWAALKFFRAAGLPVVGDFSLNVTNERTAEFFMAAGCDRVTASYDCNREQLLTLVDAVPPEWLEVVVHQHMPMFHMEHCVFCAVLSPGTNKTNCGRPCDDHAVKLRDRIGVEHPLTADVGCRNTLYNAVAQSGAEAVPALLAKGVRHLRVELLDEDDAAIGKVIAAYRELMAGVTTGRDVWTALKATNRVGVTRGTLEEKRNPLAIL
jgi:putative protease